jgi:hypothetical protein
MSTTSEETTASTHPLNGEQHTFCMSRTFNSGPCE